MSENKNSNQSIDDIYLKLKSIMSDISSINHNSKITLELVSDIATCVDNTGKKFDEIMNISNKEPKTTTSGKPRSVKVSKEINTLLELPSLDEKTSKKLPAKSSTSSVSIPNILAYIKDSYVINDKFFNDFMDEEKQQLIINSEVNKKQLDKKKKPVDKTRAMAALIYAKLSTETKKLIKERQIQQFATQANTDEIPVSDDVKHESD
jgi:hypothetical protein